MAEMTPTQQITEKILSLQNALLSHHPQIPTLLRDIHTTLRKDPNLVTTLEDEQIATVVAALKKQTNTEIVTSASKASKTSLKKITVLDL